MNTKLIAVQESDVINGEVVKTVNARELHEFLESKQQFSNWIKNRIDQYGFIQGIDFATLNNSIKRGFGGSTSTEYFITLDMAKELSMVERNEKGKQARQYFIACERAVKDQKPQLPTDYVSALEHLLASTKREQEYQRQLALDAPKVDFADRVSNGKGTMTRRNAAKCLQHPPMSFNQWLKDNRFSNRDGMPSQNEIKRGHQRVVVGENNGHTHSTPRITAKGLLYYAVKLYSSEVPDDVLGNIESFKAGDAE